MRAHVEGSGTELGTKAMFSSGMIGLAQRLAPPEALQEMKVWCATVGDSVNVPSEQF
jgi:hypothetical protein